MDLTDKILLTFDIDWAIDEVLEYTYNIVRGAGVKSTFFVTHETPFLQKLENERNVELGIHPNFNDLLNGESNIDFRKIIDNLLEIVPEAVSFRSHALANSSVISQYASQFLTHESNYYIPLAGGVTKPFLRRFGICSVPCFFMDDAAFSDKLLRDNVFKHGGCNMFLGSANPVKVFGFHPIHVYLNTENHERYAGAKAHYKDYNMLQRYVNKTNYGTRDFLTELIETGLERGFEFLNIRDIEA